MRDNSTVEFDPFDGSGPGPSSSIAASSSQITNRAYQAQPNPRINARLDSLALRFIPATLESAYLDRQALFFFNTFDKAALFITSAVILVTWLTKGRDLECQPCLAMLTLCLVGHVLGFLTLQSLPDEYIPHLRTWYIWWLRLGYAASCAALSTGCRQVEYEQNRNPTFSRSFLLDTDLFTLLYHTFALPLPYRSHVSAGAASVGLHVLLYNQQTCMALSDARYGTWFNSAFPHRHRLPKWLIAGLQAAAPAATVGAARRHNHNHSSSGLSSGLSNGLSNGTSSGASNGNNHFSRMHACWSSMLFAQVVVGFLLPACIMYILEEAARRRYLAGHRRRMQQQLQQPQPEREQQAGGAQGALPRGWRSAPEPLRAGPAGWAAGPAEQPWPPPHLVQRRR